MERDRTIDLWSVEGWPLQLWRDNASEQARRLVETEEFDRV